MSAAAVERRDVAELIYKDDLTGLYNRRYMREYLAREVRWDDPTPVPFSILMVDVDHFKKINDTYGHLVGDGVLWHLAKFLRRSFRPSDVAIRYAGDEFIVLLPATDSKTAVDLAEQTLRQLVEFKYVDEEEKREISVNMSIGAATFPDDARDPEGLIEKADDALYSSKDKGRGVVTQASAEKRKTLSEAEILRHFPCPSVVGRSELLDRLQEHLPRPEPGPTPIVVLAGESGMGKTRLIAEVVNLSQKQGIIWLVERCMEEYRQAPYHVLMAYIRQLNTNHPEMVAAVLEQTDPKEIRCLIEEVPDLARNIPRSKPIGSITDEERPQLLLDACVSFLSCVSVIAPLGMFIDDFQHIDIGTLSVLIALHARTDACMAAFAALTASSVKDPCLRGTPLASFCERVFSESEQSFIEVPLRALGREAISEMISSVFPGRTPDPSFDEALYQLTKGNPLHVEATLKDMVGSGLIRHVDEQWQFELPPESGRPASIDDAIRSRLARLDPETAEILARAAVIGPNFGLDVLKAVTGANTGYALDLLDKARRAAVVAPIPGREDEELSFVNPQVRQVTYEKLDPEQRRLIHEKVAEEEAQRHKDHIENAASMLAYHFERAGNAAKAHEFNQKARAHAEGIFDFSQALAFMRKKVGTIQDGSKPLSAKGLSHLRRVLRLCLEGLERAASAAMAGEDMSQLLESIYWELQRILSEAEVVTVNRVGIHFQVNGQWLDHKVLGAPAMKFFDALAKFDGQAITISNGIQEREIDLLLGALARTTKVSERWRWDAWRGANNVRNLSVKEKIEKPDVVRAYPVEEEEGDPLGQWPFASPVRPEAKPQEPPDASQKEMLAEFSADKILSRETIATVKDLVKRYALMNHKAALRHIMAIVDERSSSARVDIRLQAYQILGDLLDLAELSNSELLLESAAVTLQTRFLAEEEPVPVAKLAEWAEKAVSIAVRLRDHDLAQRIIWGLRGGVSLKPEAARHLQATLEKLAAGDLLETLIHDLYSVDDNRRRAAASVIEGIGEHAVPQLIETIKSSLNPRVRKAAVDVLARVGSFTGRDLLGVLTSGSSDDECDRVMSAMETLSKDLKADLHLAMGHSSANVRARTVQMLTRVRQDWAVDMLFGLANSDDTHLAAEAVRAIGESGATGSCAAEAGKRLLSLLPRLDGVAHEGLERECYLALGKLRCASALGVLQRAAAARRFFGLFGGKSEAVRTAAVWAIEQISNEEEVRS